MKPFEVMDVVEAKCIWLVPGTRPEDPASDAAYAASLYSVTDLSRPYLDRDGRTRYPEVWRGATEAEAVSWIEMQDPYKVFAGAFDVCYHGYPCRTCTEPMECGSWATCIAKGERWPQ